MISDASFSNNQKASNLIKNMTHDIRGSLVTISAILKLVKRQRHGKIDPDALDKINELYLRVTNLIGILEEYVNMTISLDEGSEIERAEQNLKREIIDPVIEELSLEIKEHDITVDAHDYPSEDIIVHVNEPLLKSVFRNLFKNAIKYGGDGCTITYGAEEMTAHTQVNVANTGEPLPQDIQDKLFIEGYSENEGGLGIGLAMVKKIIVAHGGEIWYEALEHGSNFVFTIPK